ncbi:substrate-binding domain-containing protein [Methylocella sp. CPCC 101449]|uniref:molybdate ABC transporter substrate-binding protein n=1 Tax=Methylocella sp. CPCC 101449 TaxID=2987531 RepID=UPI00288FCC4C|nr:substrate-binding domain-containing protein [Methylocella sp. CPCC 101449]MDT2023199.1 substrate-binding domain-containing protein [Methylocella sp. CPCC 101449]
MPSINILSGGAAQALVRVIEPEFRRQTGFDIQGEFGAVGMMRAKLADGYPADLVILTAAILADLAKSGAVLSDTIADIGDVETAIAVREGDPSPAIADGESLRSTLLAADAIFFPDPKTATAGIHFADVIDKLGIAEAVNARLRPFPNGATAMAAMAKASERSVIGCTQVTEIKATPGTKLVAILPPGFGLTTRYTGGVVKGAAASEASRHLLDLLSSDEAADARKQAGFV